MVRGKGVVLVVGGGEERYQRWYRRCHGLRDTSRRQRWSVCVCVCWLQCVVCTCVAAPSAVAPLFLGTAALPGVVPSFASRVACPSLPSLLRALRSLPVLPITPPTPHADALYTAHAVPGLPPTHHTHPPPIHHPFTHIYTHPPPTHHHPPPPTHHHHPTAQGGITSGSQWLVWKFESDSTLGDACEGALGPFPVSFGSCRGFNTIALQ